MGIGERELGIDFLGIIGRLCILGFGKWDGLSGLHFPITNHQFPLLLIIFHIKEIVTSVLQCERRTDVGELHFLMQEFDTRGGFAPVVSKGDRRGTVGDVTAERFGRDAENDSHVGYFEVDGGVLLDLFEGIVGVFHILGTS